MLCVIHSFILIKNMEITRVYIHSHTREHMRSYMRARAANARAHRHTLAYTHARSHEHALKLRAHMHALELTHPCTHSLTPLSRFYVHLYTCRPSHTFVLAYADLRTKAHPHTHIIHPYIYIRVISGYIYFDFV